MIIIAIEYSLWVLICEKFTLSLSAYFKWFCGESSWEWVNHGNAHRSLILFI